MKQNRRGLAVNAYNVCRYGLAGSTIGLTAPYQTARVVGITISS
ncbi:hypothetical protein ACFL2Q_01960 [Thermodesulfobacteriota bacterium]